jgi:hypothetical protein
MKKKYFNMKMMFNGLDRPFELTNLKNGRKAREVLCFTKHHSLSLSLYIYIYSQPYMVRIRLLEINLKTVLNIGKIIVSFAQHCHQITNCWVRALILTPINHLTLPALL